MPDTPAVAGAIKSQFFYVLRKDPFLAKFLVWVNDWL